MVDVEEMVTESLHDEVRGGCLGLLDGVVAVLLENGISDVKGGCLVDEAVCRSCCQIMS